ncbi:hypothetical protein K445DRAFT_374574 [Daldinia sp. EC12]|nr:hypothetical protein K445DRAFT_374574 [Daldinia sp. EC12]
MDSVKFEPNILSGKCSCQSTASVTTWKEGKQSKKRVKTSDLIPQDIKTTEWPFGPDSDVAFMVIKANEVRNCIVCRTVFIEKFRMPQFWWTDTYKRMNGYFGMEYERNDDGIIETCSTWSRALIKQPEPLTDLAASLDLQYRWTKFNIFTRWYIEEKTIILAFDPVETVQKRLGEMFMNCLDEEELRDPYWPYTRILEELVSFQGSSIWSLRDLVRSIELSPNRDPRTLREKPNYDYSRMHDIARHSIHVSETLDLSVKLSRDVIQEHEKWMKLHTNIPFYTRTYSNTHSRLVFFSHALFSLRCRSSSNHQRLSNEIQLRFHTDAQYDSQVSVEISNSAKSDGASMRWIAIVSLIFLPANLVSSVFSTTFFETANGMISVTNDFWIYWAALVAVTIMTLALWFCLSQFNAQIGGKRFRTFTVWKKAEKPIKISAQCAI